MLVKVFWIQKRRWMVIKDSIVEGEGHGQPGVMVAYVFYLSYSMHGSAGSIPM